MNGKILERKDIKDIIVKATEWAAMIVVLYVCSVFFIYKSNFKFDFFEDIPRRYTVMAPLVLVAAVRLVVCFIKDRGSAETAKDIKRVYVKYLLMLLCFLPCAVVSHRFEYVYFIYIACAAYCLNGIDADRIMKAFVVTIGVLLAATILSSLAGVLPNYIYYTSEQSRSNVFRCSYGIGYPTDLASCFVFLILFFWGSRRERNAYTIIPLVTLTLLTAAGVYFFVNSMTSVACLILTAVMMLFDLAEKSLSERYGKIGPLLKFTGTAAAISFTLLGMLFYVLTWMFGKGSDFAVKIDGWNHKRLAMAWQAYGNYGINAFGALTPQSGAGGGDIRKTVTPYEFLDSSYALMLIRYGWVLTVLAAALWVWMAVKALKAGRRNLAYAMAVIAVHAFSEHHFPELDYNILIAMPLCVFSGSGAPAAEKEKRSQAARRNGGLTGWAVFAAAASVMIFLLPGFLSKVRTVSQLKGWNAGDRKIAALIFFIVCIGLTALFCRSAYLFILIRLNRTKISRRAVLSWLLAAAVLTGAGLLWMNRVVSDGMTAQEPRLSADDEAVKLIMSAAEEPVYADTLEELYKERYQWISGRIETSEEIGRKRRGTIICEREPEKNKLIITGAVYAEISDLTSVYTYDDAVMRVLKENGYTVRGYYYTERELSGPQIALMNAAENKSSSGLSLYSGRYNAVYELSADTSTLPAEGAVCSLAITAYGGSVTIVERDVMAEEFDSDGHASAELACSIGDRAGVCFNVEPQGGADISVNRVKWRRNYSEDIWRTYDSRGRLITERYFTLDGKPKKRWNGQYCDLFEYNNGDMHWTRVKYLDENGEMITASDRYAQIVRTYGEKEGAWYYIFDQYFDAQGAPFGIGAEGYIGAYYEYVDGELTITHYQDKDGNIVSAEAGTDEAA